MANDTIILGKADKRQDLFLAMANRHGLVTGATGTGKTVSLQIMAEGFCKAGVPVFAADVKGDPSQEGAPPDFLLERAKKVDFEDYGFEAAPGQKSRHISTKLKEAAPPLVIHPSALLEGLVHAS
jgi:DNA helicase HerA-like ATPase